MRRWISGAAIFSAGCTTLSGVGDLEVVDESTEAPETAHPRDDGGTRVDANDSAVASDAEVPGEDASPEAESPFCKDINTSSLTSCVNDNTLSKSTTCADFCASYGGCCTTNCSPLGFGSAGEWYTSKSSCEYIGSLGVPLPGEYTFSRCDEPIRGNTPGTFRCCCY